MIWVYAVSLAVGVLGLIAVIFGAAFAESLERPSLDLGERFGPTAKLVVGGLAGFGMGGMSAEFSPLDLNWQVSFLIALVAAGLSVYWVRFTVAQVEG